MNIHAARIERARERMAALGVDAVLLSAGADLRYLSGHQVRPLPRLTCLVLTAAGPPRLVVPLLELAGAAASPAGEAGIELRSWEEDADPAALVAAALAERIELDGARVAFGDRMWTAHSQVLAAAMPGIVPTLAGQVLEPLRAVKDEAELASMRAAAAAVDRVHARIGEWLRPGRSEAAVSRDVADALIEEGHAGEPFATIASGPGSADPHYHTGERTIERGDVVVADIGALTRDGYWSDSTRTYVLGGSPDREVAAVHRVLEEASQAAFDCAAPGVTAEQVDAAARAVVAAAGYGDAFPHRTGHGLGMEIHEPPYIVAGNTQPLEPGMTFTVEPGIYLAGRFGCRLEDVVVHTAGANSRLPRAPRELSVL